MHHRVSLPKFHRSEFQRQKTALHRWDERMGYGWRGVERRGSDGKKEPKNNKHL